MGQLPTQIMHAYAEGAFCYEMAEGGWGGGGVEGGGEGVSPFRKLPPGAGPLATPPLID